MRNAVSSYLKSSFDHVLDQLFPKDERCGLCRCTVLVEKPYLCKACLKKMIPISKYCSTCGRPISDTSLPCPYCNPSAEPYARRFLAYQLNSEAKSLIHRYKYLGERHLVHVLSAMFSEQLYAQLKGAPLPFSVVTSIPSGKRRKNSRGFDHCQDLAKAVAKELGIPYRACLKRISHERAQAESNRAERADNLENAFRGIESDPEGRVSAGQLGILILDDVLTTGATLEAATLAIKTTHLQWVLYQGAVFYTPENALKNNESFDNFMFNDLEF